MTLNKLAKKAHNASLKKGYKDEDYPIPTRLMLIVSELGEALEATRLDKWTDKKDLQKKFDKKYFKEHIKDTFEDEIADSIIRLLELCAALGIDIEKHIKLKMLYNETREHKHGKKF